MKPPRRSEARAPDAGPSVGLSKPGQRLALAVATLIVIALLCLVARHGYFLLVESGAFITPPAGTTRPDALGVPSQQMSFASGDRMLRASYAPAGEPDAPAIAIFHGDEEEI